MGWVASEYLSAAGGFTHPCVSEQCDLAGISGEINTQNKNKGKINNCGFDPMRTEKSVGPLM